jgi:RNA polymerase sigma-70 factor (ECF subfamily)
VRLSVSEMPRLDEAAPPEVWQSYRAELVRFVARRVNDATLADDIVHDVFVKALSQIGKLEDSARLRAWLFGITRNAIADHYRARRPTEQPGGQLGGDGPEDTREAEQELARCLTPLLGALPPQYRRALTLAEVDGLTQQEIASREGLSLSGAKSRVQRARRMLRHELLACCRVELDRRGSVVDYEPRRDGCGACETPGSSVCQPADGRRAPGSG